MQNENDSNVQFECQWAFPYDFSVDKYEWETTLFHFVSMFLKQEGKCWIKQRCVLFWKRMYPILHHTRAKIAIAFARATHKLTANKKKDVIILHKVASTSYDILLFTIDMLDCNTSPHYITAHHIAK